MFQELSKRTNKNQEHETIEIEPIESITKEVVKLMLIEKLILTI